MTHCGRSCLLCSKALYLKKKKKTTFQFVNGSSDIKWMIYPIWIWASNIDIEYTYLIFVLKYSTWVNAPMALEAAWVSCNCSRNTLVKANLWNCFKPKLNRPNKDCGFSEECAHYINKSSLQLNVYCNICLALFCADFNKALPLCFEYTLWFTETAALLAPFVAHCLQ